jgi:hypothetical protein
VSAGMNAALPVHLLGKQVEVLHGRREADYQTGGGDVDCAVDGLDQLWPLRLGSEWRLCQRLQYDSTAFYWVLDRNGEVAALDTLEDPDGIGRYGFPTALAFAGRPPDSTVRAAYLTLKRLRKASADVSSWAAVAALARMDPFAYEQVLAIVLGRRVAAAVADVVLRGEVPSEGLRRRGRRAVVARRIRTPTRFAILAGRQVTRVATRLLDPTGIIVLVVGVDGVGKSTLAAQLPDACAGLFRRSVRLHWCPAVLPRPGKIVGRPAPDVCKPHSRTRHGVALSLLLLVYYWSDFLLGSFLRVLPMRARTGLVVWERGWWDLRIDSWRYGVSAPPQLVGFLGRLLPSPDLTLVLVARPEVVRARKCELHAEEILAQQERWAPALPARTPRVLLDASQSRDQMVAQAREAIVDALERRTARRLGSGWVGLPRREGARFWIPRSRAQGRAGLAVYQPVTVRARAGWELARLLSATGMQRLLPRGAAPPRAVRVALAHHLQPGGSFALQRSTYEGRFTALLLDRWGRPDAVAKIATNDRGRYKLAEEADAIRKFAPLLPEPLRAPRIRAEDEGVLIVNAVDWSPRLRPWRLDPVVARALAAFNAAGCMHGDCAPWNILRTDTGFILVDWEDAGETDSALDDVITYLARASTLLGRPSCGALRAGLDGRGWVGSALRAAADGANLPWPEVIEIVASGIGLRRSA